MQHTSSPGQEPVGQNSLLITAKVLTTPSRGGMSIALLTRYEMVDFSKW